MAQADQPGAHRARVSPRGAVRQVQTGGAEPRAARGHAGVDRVLRARDGDRGELAPVVAGVNLPEARVGTNALQQLTLGIGRQVTLANEPVMNTVDAAQAQSNVPGQPLIIPPLYTALKGKADSIRTVTQVTPDQPVDVPLAIQGDKTMRYDLLSRVMQTARLAGFKNISLQVHRVSDGG